MIEAQGIIIAAQIVIETIVFAIDRLYISLFTCYTYIKIF